MYLFQGHIRIIVSTSTELVVDKSILFNITNIILRYIITKTNYPPITWYFSVVRRMLILLNLLKIYYCL